MGVFGKHSCHGLNPITIVLLLNGYSAFNIMVLNYIPKIEIKQYIIKTTTVIFWIIFVYEKLYWIEL